MNGGNLLFSVDGVGKRLEVNNTTAISDVQGKMEQVHLAWGYFPYRS